MFNKCCVPRCANTRKDIKFHKFPRDIKVSKRWLDMIGFDFFKSLDKCQLQKNYVCHNHFEQKFCTPKGRVVGYAYPTLFTSDEIASGVPSVPQDDTGTLHRFPNPKKYSELFKTWVARIGGEITELEDDFIFKHRKVCRRHFEKDYIYPTKLCALAVPSLHLSDTLKEIRLEHGYSKKKEHSDHNYSKTDEDAFEIPELPSTYSLGTNTSKQAPNRTSQAPKIQSTVEEPDYSLGIDLQEPSAYRQAPNTSTEAPNTSTEAPNCTSEAPIIQSIVEEPDLSFGIDLPLDDFDDLEDDAAEYLSVSDASCQEDDDDLSFYLNLPKKSGNKDEDEQVLPEPNDDLHEGFMCNHCSGEIKGYRYTCVQCSDYDLCGSCEARGAHCLHYVLRIPRPKPYTEIQSVVNKIREHLKYGVDTIVPSNRIDEENEIKEEVKEEEVREDDPLGIDVASSSSDIHEDDIIFTEEFGNDDDQIIQEEVGCFLEIDSSLEPNVRPKQIRKTTVPVTEETPLRKTPTHKRTTRRSTPGVHTTTNRNDLNTVITIAPPDHTNLIQVASRTTRFTASTSQTSDANTVLTLAPQEPMKRPNDVYTMSKNEQDSTENPPKKLKMVFTPLPRGVEAGLIGLTSENSAGAENSARSRRQLTDIDPLADTPR